MKGYRCWLRGCESLLLMLPLLAGVATRASAEGRELYAQRCAECHGAKGNGDGPSSQFLNPRPAPFASALKGKTDQWIITVITEGGAAAGLSPEMPPQPNLDRNDLKELVRYIEGLRS